MATNEQTTAVATAWEPGIDFDDLDEEDVIAMKKFLIFVTDDLKFGVDANFVVEIINNNPITYLPMMPDYVRGIINLRGQIIPILDIRMRLGKEMRDNSLVIVLNIDGGQIGIMVDTVDQMIDIPVDDIMPVPTNNTQELVSGMCSLPDGSGTMMLLDCAQLMSHEQ
jgi:purine-binding chemotaxis protein CheW